MHSNVFVLLCQLRSFTMKSPSFQNDIQNKMIRLNKIAVSEQKCTTKIGKFSVEFTTRNRGLKYRERFTSCINLLLANSSKLLTNTKTLVTGLSIFYEIMLTETKLYHGKEGSKIVRFRNFKTKFK